MRFLIVTHVVHKRIGDQFFAYGPYVKEINLWIKSVSEVVILSPVVSPEEPDPIDLPYIHPKISFVEIPDFNLLTWASRLKTLSNLPLIFLKTFKEMKKADHIHLRCPGNMGLIGCLSQIVFPYKNKSAKYAGNWDPKSDQPFTYKFQREILSSEFLSKNIKVLVYGSWGAKSRNLLSFFTASYSESEKEPIKPRNLEIPLKLIFVGTLHSGKNPMISCQTVKTLLNQGISCHLDLYGDGPEKSALTGFIIENGLNEAITLHGNVNTSELKLAYSKSHFLLFASESEGWPKAVAEAMFWGCLPLTTDVSCVSEMLGDGLRGDLIDRDPEKMADRISFYLNHPQEYQHKAFEAMSWSREFTLEKFESEIQKVLLT